MLLREQRGSSCETCKCVCGDLSSFFFWCHFGHHTLFHCEYVHTCSRTHCNHICGWPPVSTRQRGCRHVASLMMFIWWLQDCQRHKRAASVTHLTSWSKSHQLKLWCLLSVTITCGNCCKHSSPQKQGTSQSVLHCTAVRERSGSEHWTFATCWPHRSFISAAVFSTTGTRSSYLVTMPSLC